MERLKFDALRDATQAAEGFFVRAPLQCVPASQTRASREQLRAGLRRKEDSIWSLDGGLKEGPDTCLVVRSYRRQVCRI
jgi:hypothetical protein